MNKIIERLINYIIIIILVCIIANMNGCFGGKEKNNDILSIEGKNYEIINRKTDSFFKIDTHIFYRDGKKIDHDIKTPDKIEVVDTYAILKDYYSRVFYKDTFKLKDTLGYFVINDTITENRILSRKFESFLNIPTIRETIYLNEIKRDFYIGPSLQIGIISSIGADFHIKTKKDILIGIGTGLNLNADPYVRTSISWKINN